MGRGGREGELWDDSALLDAFDDAMSNYKKMHGLIKKNEPVIDTSIGASAGEEKESGDQSCIDLIREVSGSGNAGLEVANELEGPTSGGYGSDPQVLEDYNKLLNEYYGIEEKRLAVWQQLQQFGGVYDHHYPAQGSGYDATLGACSTSYDHTVPVDQASLPSASCCCCCSRACDPPVATCPFPGCSADLECYNKDCPNISLAAGPGKPAPGVDFFTSAVEAAEAALSSLKMKSSRDSGSKEKESQTDIEGDMVGSNTCETDLNMVLKAWFSAGLYTGKYLAEHSVGKM